VYALNWNPKYCSLFASYNIVGVALYFGRDGGGGDSLQPKQNLGSSGATLTDSVYLRQVAGGPTAGNSGQLFVESSPGAPLTLLYAGVAYPIAGQSVRRSIRFDASLTQEVYPTDGVLRFIWNGTNRQLTFQLSGLNFSGSGSASSNSSYSAGISEATAGATGVVVSGSTYYVSSILTTPQTSQDMDSTNTQRCRQYLYPTNGLTPGTAYYTIDIVATPVATATGNITIERLY
jgi:hypothetical protein